MQSDSTSNRLPPSRSPSSKRRKCTLSISADGFVTATERTRYRNEITRKLMDMYDEVLELNECSDRMRQQLTCAMRTDPRHAKEKSGMVRLASKPVDQQEKALNDVVCALATLHDACVELVSAYLTPEEKRFLGVNSHVFQTREAKASTYQYMSPSTTAKHISKKQPKQYPTVAGTSDRPDEPQPPKAKTHEEVSRPLGASVPPVRGARKLNSISSHLPVAPYSMQRNDHRDARSADSPTEEGPPQPCASSLGAADELPSLPAASTFTTSPLPQASTPEPVTTGADAAMPHESTPECGQGDSHAERAPTPERCAAPETSLAPLNKVPSKGVSAPIPSTQMPPDRNDPPPFTVINGKRLVLAGRVVPPPSNNVITHNVVEPSKTVEKKDTHPSTSRSIRPEFRHLLIDSDSDSSAPGSH
ncbi:unnamed protein product [Phytomonas sp. EM1]|nr:unnamed protein product [Phytomonas sp. EM1]|eukprot:CCW64222.1 unnamed protein product [Phytomonas sp. isolate EM1]